MSTTVIYTVHNRNGSTTDLNPVRTSALTIENHTATNFT